jgi:hypothetical protein
MTPESELVDHEWNHAPSLQPPALGVGPAQAAVSKIEFRQIAAFTPLNPTIHDPKSGN